MPAFGPFLQQYWADETLFAPPTSQQHRMTCKGICTKYKAQKLVGTGRYASGQRRCQICEIFIKWEGIWCPCCGYRLRTKPRNLKYKAKLRARVEASAAEARANAAGSTDGPTTIPGAAPHTAAGGGAETAAKENDASLAERTEVDGRKAPGPNSSETPAAASRPADAQKNQWRQLDARGYAESKSRYEIKALLQRQPSELRIAEYVSRQPERDNHMTELIKEYRGRRCQICGTGIRQKDGRFLVEAAHIDPKKDGGVETPSNILVLCPNHHTEFDTGDRQIIERTDDRIVFDLNGIRHSLDLQV